MTQPSAAAAVPRERRFIADLADREAVDETYQAGQKQLRPNRNGNLFLQVELSDRTGSLTARVWNNGEAIGAGFRSGDYLRVEGTAQLYQGEMQIVATRLTRLPPERVKIDDFRLQVPSHVPKLVKRLEEILRTIRNPHLRTLVDCYLIDPEFMQKFSLVPAGVKNHHAHIGGLIEHVVQLAEGALRMAEVYPYLDRDLLLVGVFLHDSGKTEELSCERGLSYTDEGQLLGHIVQGILILEKKAAAAAKLAGEPIPAEVLLQVRHLIVSHHGEAEFGSPRVPMTLEAAVLHHLDNLDAKLEAYRRQFADDPNPDAPWTNYSQQTGRKLYRGRPAAEAE